MQDYAENIASLIDKYLKEELTPAEQEILREWRTASENNESLFRNLTSKEELFPKISTYSRMSLQSEAIWNKTLQQINQQGKVVRMHPERTATGWWKYAAAAVIVLSLSAGGWYYLHTGTQKEMAANNTPASTIANSNEIGPGGDKAILTLADNSTVALDKTSKGIMAQQGNTQISNSDGRLIYSHDPKAEGQEMYNIVSTPRGGQYKVTLPDGTQVWLNAASSLRFPTAFAGNSRQVQLTGEAYFEIAEDATKPFTVAIKPLSGAEETLVQVLGTHFNVMAYGDEDAMEATLLQGSVKVLKGKASSLLKPGQQARLKDNNIKVVTKPDAKDVIAWTNGYFAYNGASTKAVLRQIARWYDIDIIYEGNVPDQPLEYYGKLPRNAKLESILKVLSVNKINIRVKQGERKLIVTS